MRWGLPDHSSYVTQHRWKSLKDSVRCPCCNASRSLPPWANRAPSAWRFRFKAEPHNRFLVCVVAELIRTSHPSGSRRAPLIWRLPLAHIEHQKTFGAGPMSRSACQFEGCPCAGIRLMSVHGLGVSVVATTGWPGAGANQLAGLAPTLLAGSWAPAKLNQNIVEPRRLRRPASCSRPRASLCASAFIATTGSKVGVPALGRH